MRTLALCGASCKRRSFFYCTGAAWKSLQLLPLLSFYLYLWSRVVSRSPGPCGLGLWASRMNFACTEFSEVRMYRILGSPMLGVLRFVGHDDYFHKPPDS
jgi:hypothetical protein